MLANCSFTYLPGSIWGFPEMGVPPTGLFITEHTIKMDDLGVLYHI